MKKISLIIMPLMAIPFLVNCGSHETCIVSFDTDGGSFIASQRVEKGKTMIEPDKPTKTDYCFRGWLLDGNSFDFATPIEQNITLTANWNLYEFDYDDDCPYLTFNAEEDSVAHYDVEGVVDIDMKYSTDMNNWISWGENEIIEINKGNKIYIKNEKDHLSIDSNNYVQFYLAGKIAASGQISSLTKSSTIHNHEYFSLFRNCDELVRAPALPATTLADYCYEYMFRDCYSLKEAPELPATTLAEGCYYYMFRGCYSLKEAPKLLATELKNGCYTYMFYGCYNLSKVEVGFGQAESGEWPTGNNTDSWLELAGVATHTAPIFIWKGNNDVTRDGSHVPSNWIINPIQ